LARKLDCNRQIFAENNFLKPDFQIQAATKDYSIDLNLKSQKPLVLQGEKVLVDKVMQKTIILITTL